MDKLGQSGQVVIRINLEKIQNRDTRRLYIDIEECNLTEHKFSKIIEKGVLYLKIPFCFR